MRSKSVWPTVIRISPWNNVIMLVAIPLHRRRQRVETAHCPGPDETVPQDLLPAARPRGSVAGTADDRLPRPIATRARLGAHRGQRGYESSPPGRYAGAQRRLAAQVSASPAAVPPVAGPAIRPAPAERGSRGRRRRWARRPDTDLWPAPGHWF